MSLSRLGDFSSLIKFISFSALSGATTYYLMNPRVKKSMSMKDVIVTTGCDSGLGYSIAVHCHNNLNMSVVACVLNQESRGASKLKELFSSSKRFHLVELDVTIPESVQKLKKFVEQLLEQNKDLRE